MTMNTVCLSNHYYYYYFPRMFEQPLGLLASENSVVITQKLADLLSLQLGDFFSIHDTEGKVYKLQVEFDDLAFFDGTEAFFHHAHDLHHFRRRT